MAKIWTGNRAKLLAAGLLLLGAATGAFLRSPSGRLSEDVNFVCVATGKTYRLDRDELVRVPATNPKTGEATLLPCDRENGVLYVSPRYHSSLLKLAEKNRYVDPQTLAVRSTP